MPPSQNATQEICLLRHVHTFLEYHQACLNNMMQHHWDHEQFKNIFIKKNGGHCHVERRSHHLGKGSDSSRESLQIWEGIQAARNKDTLEFHNFKKQKVGPRDFVPQYVLLPCQKLLQTLRMIQPTLPFLHLQLFVVGFIGCSWGRRGKEGARVMLMEWEPSFKFGKQMLMESGDMFAESCSHFEILDYKWPSISISKISLSKLVLVSRW